MVNIGKKFSDVAFQNPTSPSIVLTDFLEITAEFINSFMRAFIIPARI